MSNAMIERVAKAICIVRWGEDAGWNSYVDFAGAAITAMRKPTDAMINEGNIFAHEGFCENAYRVMIDVALKDD